jgi:hypothetical protein
MTATPPWTWRGRWHFSSDGARRAASVVRGLTPRQSILCSAILADPVNSVPIVMTSLPVIRKTTQLGD